MLQGLEQLVLALMYTHTLMSFASYKVADLIHQAHQGLAEHALFL
jgi:hypothetical protein